MDCIIHIGSVAIEVTFKAIKNLHLSVHPPDGRVTISTPDFYDLDKIKIYAATKLGWIKKEQAKIRSQEREEPREYITQESHQFLGKRYLLRVTKGDRNCIVISSNKLIVQCTDPEDRNLKEKIVYQFYRRELRKQLQAYVVKYSKEMALEVPNFKIRSMKTKWGSCAVSSQRLWFNIELAKKPLACIEYIVVHELVHLIERNHNKRFVSLMDQYFPNWQVQKKLLNELPILNISLH